MNKLLTADSFNFLSVLYWVLMFDTKICCIYLQDFVFYRFFFLVEVCGVFFFLHVNEGKILFFKNNCFYCICVSLLWENFFFCNKKIKYKTLKKITKTKLASTIHIWAILLLFDIFFQFNYYNYLWFVSGLYQKSSMIEINKVFRRYCFYFFYSIIEVIDTKLQPYRFYRYCWKKVLSVLFIWS